MSQNVGPIVMNPKRKMTLRRKIFIISFLVLPILHFIVFYIYPNFNAFLMGFQKTENGKLVWTIEHFIDIFARLGNNSDELVESILNTLKTFGINMIMYPVSILVSYFLYKKVFGHNVFRVLFFLPQIVSGVVFAFVFRRLCQVDAPLHSLVETLYKIESKQALLADPRFANTFVFVMMIWLGFPGSMIIWGGTFARIPDSVLEYARIDGVGWIREVVSIILPMVWPTFSLFLVLQFATIFSSSGPVFLLTQGAHGTQTLHNWFYMQVFGQEVHPNSNALNYMSAFGLLITFAGCTLSLLTRKGLVKLLPEEVMF